MSGTINPTTMLPGQSTVSQPSDISASNEADGTSTTGTSVGLPTSVNDEVSFLQAAGGDNTSNTTDGSPSLVTTGESPLGFTPPLDPYTQAVVDGTMPPSQIYQQPQSSGFSLSFSSPWVKYAAVASVVLVALVILYLKRGAIAELFKETKEEIE